MIEKTHLNQILPLIAGVCLSASPITAKESAISTYGSSTRRMNAILGSEHLTKKLLSEKDFQLKNFDGVAVSTDLETDDVFALAILFDEANRIYQESGKFPIDMIIVGEGNAAIKRMRMEKLLKEYFDVPEGVRVRVVEGKSTQDNIFPQDGEELFEKGELGIPFPEIDQTANSARAIEEWAASREKPFLIQLKPAQELLLIDDAAAEKISLLFYGSFNIRKTVEKGASLQNLMDRLADKFEKIGVLETFSVMGEDGKIANQEWSEKIRSLVQNGSSPFILMFRDLMTNWNTNILQKKMNECQMVLPEHLYAELIEVSKNWDAERFDRVYKEALLLDIEDKAGFIRGLKIIRVIAQTPVQFTLADILVAMACTTGTDLFVANPVNLQFDENGYIHSELNLKSNVIYYGSSNVKEIAAWIEQFLQ